MIDIKDNFKYDEQLGKCKVYYSNGFMYSLTNVLMMLNTVDLEGNRLFSYVIDTMEPVLKLMKNSQDIGVGILKCQCMINNCVVNDIYLHPYILYILADKISSKSPESTDHFKYCILLDASIDINKYSLFKDLYEKELEKFERVQSYRRVMFLDNEIWSNLRCRSHERLTLINYNTIYRSVFGEDWIRRNMDDKYGDNVRNYSVFNNMDKYALDKIAFSFYQVLYALQNELNLSRAIEEVKNMKDQISFPDWMDHLYGDWDNNADMQCMSVVYTSYNKPVF